MEDFEKVDIGEEIFSKTDGVNLESMYEQCNNELTLQQSKRDQIIAVYISVAGFIIPSILGLNLGALPMAAAFFLLFVIGATLCKVVVRYRVYKEVYWVTSRTIAALFCVEDDLITRHRVQKLFADNLRRGYDSVIAVKKDWEDKVGENALQNPVSFAEAVDRRKTAKKIASSAETQLYSLLTLMSAATLALSVFFAASALLALLPLQGILPLCIAILLAALGGALAYRSGMRFYIAKLTAVYAYCFDGERESFNAAYAKAWFLHGFRR